MAWFVLHPSHGFSLPTKNGEDARGTLEKLKTKEDVTAFKASLGLRGLKNNTTERVVIIVGSGMSPLYSGMSTPSWARARKALELYNQNPWKILLIPSARFTYRQMDFFSGKTNPPITDARRISEHFVRSGILPEQIITEEWSNCTFWNGVFVRLILDSFLHPDIPLTVVTSDWALERSQIVFWTICPDSKIDFVTVSGDLDPNQEKQRRKQERIVNDALYRPSIQHYGLSTGDPLMRAIWYLRDISTSTPWNQPDKFALAANAAVKKHRIKPEVSYWIKI